MYKGKVLLATEKIVVTARIDTDRWVFPMAVKYDKNDTLHLELPQTATLSFLCLSVECKERA